MGGVQLSYRRMVAISGRLDPPVTGLHPPEALPKSLGPVSLLRIRCRNKMEGEQGHASDRFWQDNW